MGMRANVIKRQDADFSNGGLSSRVLAVTVQEVEAGQVAGPDAPAVRIVKRTIGGRVYVHAEPADLTEAQQRMIGPMAGGAFIETCDSRFRELTGVDYPVPLHDRFESPAEYAMHCR